MSFDGLVLSTAGKARRKLVAAIDQRLMEIDPKLPVRERFSYWNEGHDLAARVTGVKFDIFQACDKLHLCAKDIQGAVVQLVGEDHPELPLALSDQPSWVKRGTAEVDQILMTAHAFRIAVDALPVGKDIRGRLLAHVDAHITAIEALQ
ncbi:hypothetical protein [Sphingomonas sp.]|uniref:hypothetical protein n=1 Tax=Sphingomonas sp. TaxID=28214 RepID=UPI0025F0FF52|nr:hypothetical protein [Sphingomonas sp.]